MVHYYIKKKNCVCTRSYSEEGVSVSRSFHYSAGSAQEFKEEGFTLRPADFEDELTYDPENEHTSFPVVILMETDTPQGKQASHIIVPSSRG